MTHIEHLFQHPEHVERVAEWIYGEFWSNDQVHSPQSLARLLLRAISADEIPLSRLAIVDGEPVGTVNLIENDDEKRPHLRPWLAALYVVPEQRRRGVGSALVRDLQHCAARLEIETLYLGTDNPGFYSRLGAEVEEQVTTDFAVMRLKTLS